MTQPKPQAWADDNVANNKPSGMSTFAKIGCGCLIAVLLLGGGCAFLAWKGLGAIKDTEPYRHAFKRAQSSPGVQAALGQPIKDGVLGQFNYHFDGDGTAQASLQIPVSGPDGEATVVVEATRDTNEVWTYHKLEAKLSGATIDLRE